MLNVLEGQGAKSVRVDSGPFINTPLAQDLRRRVARAADEGRTFLGFSVRRTNDPLNEFILEKVF